MSDPLPTADEAHLQAKSSSYATPPPKATWAQTLSLAVVSLGIIYGDIGTSPL